MIFKDTTAGRDIEKHIGQPICGLGFNRVELGSKDIAHVIEMLSCETGTERFRAIVAQWASRSTEGVY